MKYENYIEKLEMIEKQYNFEEALTPIVYQVIDNKNYSIIVVQNARKKKAFYGISSNPDLVILSKNFTYSDDQLEKIYGCIELKNIGSTLITGINELLTKIKKYGNRNKTNQEIVAGTNLSCSNKDLGQLLGEVLWYRKVLYTNGHSWRFLYLEFSDNYSEEKYFKDIIEFVENENKIDEKMKSDIKYEINEKVKNDLITEKDFLTQNWFCRLSEQQWIDHVSIKEISILDKDMISEIEESDYKKMIQKVDSISWKDV